MKHSYHKCFVIMPFGEKADVDGKILDFDKIYNYLIKKSVESLNIKCIRCDEIDEAGWIHSKMFEQIYESDIAVVDITSLNPNVFYELGVRHALAKSVTVLIRRKGTKIPFNITGFQVIEYDPEDIANVDETKKKISDFIRNGLKLQKKDSPVHEVLDLKIGTESKRLKRTETFLYKLRKSPNKFIGLITGDIQNVKVADIWVNSENTNMQMARHYDRSISSVVRYYGAKRDAKGNVVEDTVANELLGIVGEHVNVTPATVIATGSGTLQQTHNVKKIFHAASVVGQVGKGYTPIPDIRMCVWNSLEKADSEELCNLKINSILFPLMGTGTGRGALEEKALELIDTAISYLESHPNSCIQKVYFLAWNDKQLEVCQRILHQANEVIVA